MTQSMQLTLLSIGLFFHLAYKNAVEFFKRFSIKDIFLKIYNYFIYFKKNRQYRKWQKAIYNGILDKNQEKTKLLNIIFKEIKTEKHRVQTSKYIPLTRKNKDQIKAMIEGKHHREMKFLGIKLSNELQFV
jgi:hypothetical protein